MSSKLTQSMTYHLNAYLRDNQLYLNLHSNDEFNIRNFQGVISCNLPQGLNKYFKNIAQVYDWLKDNRNFQVNPMKGEIVLKKYVKNLIGRYKDQQCKIVLDKSQDVDRLVSNIAKMESQINQSLKNKIRQLTLPSEKLPQQIKVVQTSFVKEFKIFKNVVQYSGEDNKGTQLLLNQVILKKDMFDCEIKIVKTVDRWISIGITERDKQISQRSSMYSENTYSYFGKNGRVQCERKKSKLYKLSGSSFDEGDVVRMQVQLSRGVVRWYVNDNKQVEIREELLKYSDKIFVPFIEMSNTGDRVEYLS